MSAAAQVKRTQRHEFSCLIRRPTMANMPTTSGDGRTTEAASRTEPADWGFVVLTLREAAALLGPNDPLAERPPGGAVDGEVDGAWGDLGRIYTSKEAIGMLARCISRKPPPKPPDPPRGVDGLMTPKQAAATLGVSVKTLLEHVEAGAISFINVGTKTRQIRRFAKYTLDRFIEKRKKEFAPCPPSSVPALKSTATTSGSKAVDFLAVPKPQPRRRPTR
jgi:excisionase family DNA binding protein